jgi:hypothetical protein
MSFLKNNFINLFIKLKQKKYYVLNLILDFWIFESHYLIKKI